MSSSTSTMITNTPPFPTPEAIADMLSAFEIPVSTTHFTFTGVPRLDIPCHLYHTPLPRPDAPIFPKVWDTQEEHLALLSQYELLRAQFKKDMLTHRTPSESPLPTPSLILTHGRGSTFDHAPTAAFAMCFAKHAPALGFIYVTNDLNPKAAVFRSLLTTYPSTPAFGGRSAGSHAAARGVSYTSVKNLIFFTYPLCRDMEMRNEALLALTADTNVLFVSGNNDHMSIEIILRAVRKRMRARTWWIKVDRADHRFKFLESIDRWPDRAERICDVARQLAARWLLGERDPDRTEIFIAWDEEGAIPTVTLWTEMVPDKVS